MEDYEKALPLYQRALKIVEKKFGQNHPNTVIIKENYDWLLSKINEENKEK
ncbi:tetratricopeptide repeat protein [Methanosarcina hadiensis]|uniref:tetratricopeptide repeat protein n=1 Tax=Methanosarcina hadiensis TaxID=3078083 RepID=UPI003977723D